MIQFMIFISVFLIVFYGMHLYVASRVSSLFSFRMKIGLYVLMFVLAVSYPLASFLVKTTYNPLTRSIYTISSVWLGMVFLLFSMLLLNEVLMRILRYNPRIAGYVILSAMFVLTAYGLINAGFIRINEVSVPVSGIDEEVRIVQLSDVHVGTIHDKDYTSMLVSKSNSLSPDMVLITGDLFDGSGGLIEESIMPLDDIDAPVYFAAGNHEIYEGIDNVERLLRKTKVIFLRDEVIEEKGLQIIGIDYREGNGLGPYPLDSIEFDRSRPSVLMYHSPSYLDHAVRNNITLQLSGHTHNGQIIPFNLLVKIAFPKIKGLYDLGGSYLYVSPGSGTWGPPMRIGSRSEVTLIRLVPE